MDNYPLIAFIITSVLFVVLFIYHLKYRKKVETKEEMQIEFMAVMIHELRSPLSVIKSASNMLYKESEHLTADQISEMLKQIEDSSTGLLGIVSNLLDVAKIEAGKVELFKKETDVNAFLEKEAGYYESLADKSGLELKLDLDPELKPINCDKEKLGHIMNNLISNSIKYTQKGGVVTVQSKGFRKYAQISVIDTGKGIPDDMKKKLFNKFTRARESTKSKEKGTGLGLVIVKGMIEAHGGRIWIDDNKPHGTKFNFTLPHEN